MASKSIQEVMSYAIRVGLNMDAKDAVRNLNTFRREVGFAKAATQDITGTVKLFNEITKDLGLSSRQVEIVEARLTAAHERRTAKIREETAALKENRDTFAAGLRNIGTSQLAQDLQRSRAGADAFAAGLRNINERAQETAAAMRASQAAVSGWANGLRQVNTSQLAQDLQRSRAGADAFNAGLAQLSAQNLSRDSAALEANITARERHNQVLASGRQYMQQFETGQQAMFRQLQEANAQFRSGAITLDQYNQATNRIRQNNNLLYQSFTQLRTAVTTLLGPLVLVYSAYQSFVSSIKLSAELEQATAKFKVFTGSLREAEQTLAEIRDLSRSSPVSFTGGQRAVTTMLQFGVASKDVTKSLRQIAEITGGDTERMNNLALAFGQANAAGRLMGQELLQMVNAGFNPLKIISDKTGESMKSLKDRMSEGEISFQQVADAFRDAVGPGGQFNGLLQEMANTTAGQLTKASNAVQELGIAFGDLLALGGTGSVLGAFTQSINDFTLAINNLKNGLGTLPGELGDVQSAFKLLNLTTPQGLFGQTTDTIGTIFAKSEGDIVRFADNVDRIVQRIGEKNARGIFSEQDLTRAKEIRKALTDIEAIREKAAKDRTVVEQNVLDFTNRRDRSARNVSQDEFDRLRDQAKRDFKNAGANRPEVFVEFVEKVGQGFIDDSDLAVYKEYVAEIERANQALTDQTRIRGVFQESIAKEKDDLLDNRFGKDRAANVRLIRDQAVGPERARINRAIENGADYERIVRFANAEAREQLKTLAAIQAKNKAYDDAKEKQKEAAKAAKDAATEAERAAKEKAREDEQRAKRQAEELKKLKKQADEIRNAGNPFKDFIDKASDAELLNRKGLLSDRELAAEKNRLAAENVKNVTATAAPVINKGSQEAFAAITGQTVDKLTRQLQEAEKANILATTAAQVRQKTLDKLDELIDDKPGVVGS